jgi:hypothetical protein
MTSAADLIAAARAASLVKETMAGLDVHLRGLTGGERRILVERGKANDPMTAQEIVAIGVCLPDGQPMLSIEDAEQIDGGELDRIAKRVLQISKLLPEAQDEAAKN